MVHVPGDQRSASGISVSTFTGSVDSRSTMAHSQPDLARVFVRLATGTKIVVPVPQTSTVQDVHAEALRRAARFGIRGTLNNTALETTGSNRVALFGEDNLIDVLDLTADSTFALGFLGDLASQQARNDGIPPASSPRSMVFSASCPSGRIASEVYIRWITLEAAMEASRLRRIPADRSPVPRNTNLNDLHRIATERLCGSSPEGSCTNPRKLCLFLRECRLHAENNPATLSELGLQGDKSRPLDIFVEFVGPENRISLHQLSESTDPKRIWSFDSTKRGMSTFVTSLEILFKEIERGRCNLDGILEVLLELTHFPPLLLAFKTLYETGIEAGTSAEPLLSVASAFHALCRKMAPSWACLNSVNALEASRQVIWWIYTSRSESSLNGKSKQIIHRTQVLLARDGYSPNPTFKPFQEISSQSSGNQLRKFLVSIEEGNNDLCQLLGLATHEKASSPWEFYFLAANGWDELWDHKLLPTLNANEFENLIKTTNSMDAFRMVGPMQLGGCLAAELPVITLSAKGYVSKYTHEDMECSERRFITWNAVEKRITLPDNPGQLLSEKLDTILIERKKNRKWEVDAWAEWTKTADFGPPDEAIVICVDTSSSMRCSMPAQWLPDADSLGIPQTRLEQVKEFFRNFSLRVFSMNPATHLGLVTFSNKEQVITKQPVTALQGNFRHQLDNMFACGSTAIFDALNKASNMLIEVRMRYPQSKCRIILLTDGQDNDSHLVPSVVSSSLFTNNIVLDAVVIGTDETKELFKIVRNTGGYAFAPQTQQDLFQIFLLETVIDIRTRPDIVRTVPGVWDNFQPKAADMSNPYDFPPCRPHPNLDDYFIALGDAERFMSRLSRGSTLGSAASNRSSIATTLTGTTAGAGGNSRILLSEIKAMIDNPHTYIDVYVSQRNMGFWKVVMQGPPDSVYANGTFLLFVEIGPDFPRRPPSARFITPVLHPNITKHGRICHPVFDREWTPATRVFQVLQQVYGILISLEARDAVDPISTLRFWTDEQAGRREVEKYINHFARHSRALHRSDIIGDDVSSIASSSVSSIASDATITTPNRSPPSISGLSVRSSSTLIARRPPLMTTPEDGVSPTSRSHTAEGDDGRGRLLRSTSSIFSFASGQRVNTAGGIGEGGRTLSRRSSFFDMLRRI